MFFLFCDARPVFLLYMFFIDIVILLPDEQNIRSLPDDHATISHSKFSYCVNSSKYLVILGDFTRHYSNVAGRGRYLGHTIMTTL